MTQMSPKRPPPTYAKYVLIPIAHGRQVSPKEATCYPTQIPTVRLSHFL